MENDITGVTDDLYANLISVFPSLVTDQSLTDSGGARHVRMAAGNEN